jgi:uncharacterized protein YkwD
MRLCCLSLVSLLAGLGVFAQAPAAPESVDLAPVWGPTSYTGMEAVEATIIKLTNLERFGLGLKGLKPNPQLAIAARQHSREMGEKDYFAHESPVAEWREPWQRAYRAGYWGMSVGENIVMVRNGDFANDDAIAADFVRRWMNSKPHRENILKPDWSLIGVGVVKVGNAIFGTQLFADPQTTIEKATLTPATGEQCALEVQGEARAGIAQVNVFVNGQFVRSADLVGGKFSVSLAYPRDSGRYTVMLAAGNRAGWSVVLDTARDAAILGRASDYRAGLSIAKADGLIAPNTGYLLRLTATVPPNRIVQVSRDGENVAAPKPDADNRFTTSIPLPARDKPYTINVAVAEKNATIYSVEELIFVDTRKPLVQAFLGRP